MALRARSRTDVILLPVRSEFASRIYSGEKRYELRKVGLPKKLRYVVVLEGETRQITGGYVVGTVHRAPISVLWHRVGERTITRERFEGYFEGYKEGLALEIRRAERLPIPIDVANLTDVDNDFSVPPQFSFVYLPPLVLEFLRGRLGTLAEVMTRSTGERIDAWIGPEFRELDEDEADDFRALALQYVGKWYDEIDRSFPDRILETHRRGHDRFGYFTLTKKVYTVLHEGEVAGYTVVTWKRGGSVKFGPTLLKLEFQNLGLGPRIRRVLDDHLAAKGARKSYSTIPDTHLIAVRYLIKSGHRIEGHLRQHYTPEHDDLVFGRILKPQAPSKHPKPPTRRTGADLLILDEVGELDSFTDFLMKAMPAWYDGIDETFAKSVVTAQTRFDEGDLSEKGKKVFIGLDGSDIVVALICSIKRGGAVKLSPLVSIVEVEAARLVLEAAEKYFVSLNRVRKLYSLVPLTDVDLASLFRDRGYQAEGILREPYRPGIDMIVYGALRDEIAGGPHQ